MRITFLIQNSQTVDANLVIGFKVKDHGPQNIAMIIFLDNLCVCFLLKVFPITLH